MSKVTEQRLAGFRAARNQKKIDNQNARESRGGFGKGTTSGSTYLKRSSSNRSAYGSNPNVE